MAVAAAYVKLRPLKPEDLEDVHALLSKWEVVRYMLLPLCSQEAAEKFLRDSIREASGTPWRSIVRAMIDETRSFAGLCGIGILRGADEGELWYLVRPDRWGRGLATAAAAGLLEFGFAELRLHRMWACCVPENPASARVLEKVGMRREGLSLKNLKIHGVWCDSILYAMLVEEWQAGRQPARSVAAP